MSQRTQVAALVAGARPEDLRVDELDEQLQVVAFVELLLRPWHFLVSDQAEQLVDELGGDARDVEQLRREGALARAA